MLEDREQAYFREHHVVDKCKMTVNFASPVGWLRIAAMRVRDIELIKNLTSYGIKGNSVSRILSNAEEAVREFVLQGGTQKTSEVTYYSPARINIDNLPTVLFLE